MCGASSGGRVALELASSPPDLVERLVLLAPAFAPWEWGPEMAELDADLPDLVAIARHIGEQVPRARVEVLPGAGHLLALERPDDVARALRA